MSSATRATSPETRARSIPRALAIGLINIEAHRIGEADRLRRIGLAMFRANRGLDLVQIALGVEAGRLPAPLVVAQVYADEATVNSAGAGFYAGRHIRQRLAFLLG